MSRRRPKRDRDDRRRGRHRRSSSPETARWEELELVPERPPWMSPDTYRALYRLRGEL